MVTPFNGPGRAAATWGLLTAAAFLVAGSGRAATTYYVTTNGTDGALGTSWPTAWRTIAYAATHVVDGDEVIVSNGTYVSAATINLTNAITLVGTNGADVTIIDAANQADVRCLQIGNAGVVVRGFTLYRGVHSARGAGVYMTGGTVEWCTIRACDGESDGGAVLMTGGLIHHCIIRDNLFGNWNGTIYMMSGSPVVRNCLIVRNTYRRGAAVFIGTAGGRVENCTVVDNNASEYTGGIYNNGGTVVDTIMYFNTDPDDTGENFGAAGTFAYCASDPLPSGTGNITGDPLFINRSGYNYRLLAGSPCTNVGTTNLAWLAADPSAVDLDGHPRVVGGRIDMGCYQYLVESLDCTFTGSPLSGISPHTTVFTSFVAGTNLAGVSYYWDVDGDGSTDAQGAVLTNEYASAGTYSVSLVVSNAAGETDSYVRSNYVQVAPAVCYVSMEGSHTFPYDAWGRAASNVQAAVGAAVDGTDIWVTNGVYIWTNQISITKGILLRSINGRAVTALKVNNTGARTLYLSHPDAVVDGFTIDRQSSSGGGVQMHLYGLLANCDILRGGWEHGFGANLTMSGGVASNCTITGGSDRHIGGVYLSGGGAMAVNCVISSNRCKLYETVDKVGGVSVLSGCTLRNCLVSHNTGVGLEGGVYNNGVVESCTIVSNVTENTNAAAACGGIRSQAGTIRNCIVVGNASTAGGAASNWLWAAGTIQYTCTMPDASARGEGNVTGDPLFGDWAGGDYRLRRDSPCVDTGTNQSWMVAALDLDGLERLQGGRLRVDMGAYEAPFRPAGTVILLR